LRIDATREHWIDYWMPCQSAACDAVVAGRAT